jgi:phenylacetate-CoA ligase
MCDWATYKVPAYKDLTKKSQKYINFWNMDLTSYPVTDKENYVKKYSFADRARFGELQMKNVMIDESSGSTGAPMNWIRSRKELSDIHTFSANYVRMTIPLENLITINAFSMGAWATGLNTTLSLLKISAVKSIGPDIDKIINTLETFGPKYPYLICGYPPFLKHLIDEMDKRQFEWKGFSLYGIVGGEGMTEALREYLERKFVKVRSGYGATDLQLGVGGENDFTVWLRKELVKNNKLKAVLLGKEETRIPMIFHYNPLDHFVEISGDSEIIVTINNFEVLCPRVRYNVHDEGMIVSIQEIETILKNNGYNWETVTNRFKNEMVALPLLFVYGRKDGTISYMGANIYPQDVEYGLYKDDVWSKHIHHFMLQLKENEKAESRPAIYVELRSDSNLSEADKKNMVSSLQKEILQHLLQINRDFAASTKEDVSTSDIIIVLEDFGKGVFGNKNIKKIKNTYIV